MLTARLTRVLATTGPGGGYQHPGERKQDGDPDLGHAVWPIGAHAYQRLQEEEAENWEQGAHVWDMWLHHQPR